MQNRAKWGSLPQTFCRSFVRTRRWGRFFGPEDDQENAPSTVILSHELWVRKFSSDSSIIGASVPLGGKTSTVIAVLPASFQLIFPEDASVPPNVDYFQSIPIGPWEPNGPAFLHVVGRLRHAGTLPLAQAELATIAEQINSIGDRTKVANYHLSAFSLQDDDVHQVRPTLYLLFGAAAFVLLIGCANVANLLMIRARQRIREITIRAALGASTGRLVRQIVMETVMIVLLGGVVALLLGWAALKGIVAVQPSSFAHLAPVSLDGRALAFTFAVALLISIPVGAAPISIVRHLRLSEDLKRGGKSTTHRRQKFAALLVATEVALAYC